MRKLEDAARAEKDRQVAEAEKKRLAEEAEERRLAAEEEEVRKLEEAARAAAEEAAQKEEKARQAAEAEAALVTPLGKNQTLSRTRTPHSFASSVSRDIQFAITGVIVWVFFEGCVCVCVCVLWVAMCSAFSLPALPEESLDGDLPAGDTKGVVRNFTALAHCELF